MEDTNQIRCVKGDKVKFFRRETAMKPAWQRSTGWTPQEISNEVKAQMSGVSNSEEGSEQLLNSEKKKPGREPKPTE